MNVYRLHAEITHILAKVEDDGEVPSDELLQAIDRLNASIPERVNTLYKVLRSAVASSTALRNEAQYAVGKARRWENLQDFVKECLKSLLRTLKVDSFETEICRITTCKGRPRVEVEEGFNLATLSQSKWAHLIETTHTLKAVDVHADVKMGRPLPEQIRIVEGEPYLRIT